MRDLDDSLLLKLLKHDLSISSILSFSRMDIGHIEPNSAFAPNICLVDASHNNLKSVDAVWSKLCPSAWWIDASFNQITEINMELLPYAMGSLNLSSNCLLLKNLHALRSTYILRLTLLGGSDANCSILSNLNPTSYRPMAINLLINTWVLDDKYISHMERLVSSKFSTNADDNLNQETPQSIDDQFRQQWGTRLASEREISIMRLVQCIPLDSISSDYCRLEVLLEDYLEEARLITTFNRSHLSCGKTKMSSTSVNMLQLLSMPHKVRLDLSVLLTASILFTIPKQLLKDTLVQLLSSHIPMSDILSYCSLPSFINTAVVSVIRRICRRELQELAEMNTLPPKPTCKEFPKHTSEHLSGLFYSDKSEDLEPPTYVGSLGFNHLQPFKRYLERPISVGIYNTLGTAVPSEFAFSSLELEILNTLPDVPCMCSIMSPNDSSIKWLGLAARHTILLMSAAPGFPSLTRTLRNKVDQGLCDLLAPILEAARIGLTELEIEQACSDFEGRSTLNGDRGLRFGTGIPAGRAEELYWRKNTMQGVMKQKTRKILELETDNFSPGSTGDWTPVKLPSTAHLIRPPSFNLGHQCEDELGPLLRSVSVRDDTSTSERQTPVPIKIMDDNLLDLDEPLLGQFILHDETSQGQRETERTVGSSLTPSQQSKEAPAHSELQSHVTDSSLKDSTVENNSSVKNSFTESKVLGSNDDVAWKSPSLLGPISGVTSDSKIQGERKKILPEKLSFWEEAGRTPVTVGAEMPDSFNRMQFAVTSSCVVQTSSRTGSAVGRMRLGDHSMVRERAVSRDRLGGMDQRDDDDTVRRKLFLEMGTLRNIRQLNDGFSEKFCSSLKIKHASKLGIAPGDWKASISRSSDSASKSLLSLATASSSSDIRNYGRIRGESCRDMILMRGGSMGAMRRVSSEKDCKNDLSGIPTIDKGDPDSCHDPRERSLSNLSDLSQKASIRVPDRCEPSLHPGVRAPATAEMTRTPHGKNTESQLTRLSPTPLTRASISLTCHSINTRAIASDAPHTDAEERDDTETSHTDSSIVPVIPTDQENESQNETCADIPVRTGHIRTGIQAAPLQQSRAVRGSGDSIAPLHIRNSEGIRGPGSLVISGRVQGVSSTGTNSSQHRAATHKLSYTHNYRCMYQSQRMQSSVFKKPESEGLGFIVKVLNYNASLPQGPKEIIKK